MVCLFVCLIKARIAADCLTNPGHKEGVSGTDVQVAPGSRELQDLSVSQLSSSWSDRPQAHLRSSDVGRGVFPLKELVSRCGPVLLPIGWN